MIARLEAEASWIRRSIVTAARDPLFHPGGMLSAADVIAARGNPHGPSNPAGVANRYDFNRDGAVDALDLILARANATSPLSALRLITVPGPSLHITAVPEPAGIWPALLGWLCLLMSRRRKR